MNLSILMPTYNCGLYISSAIRSILSQTFKDFEFLIIDDGSEDNTDEIIHSIKDSRIRYIKKEHSGLASSLNYGLNLCTYEWVARMDADDISHPMRMQKQVENGCFEINSINCTWSCYFKDNKILYTIDTPTDTEKLLTGLALHSYICHPSVIYNKNFILQQGGYEKTLPRIEDYELWLRIMNSCIFFVLPEYLLFMRIRRESLSRENLKENRNITYSFQKTYYYSFEENFKTKDTRQIQLIKGWREYFYGNSDQARKEWRKACLSIFTNPKIIVAYFVSYLPESVINSIRESRIRLRIVSFYKRPKIQKSFEKLQDDIST